MDVKPQKPCLILRTLQKQEHGLFRGLKASLLTLRRRAEPGVQALVGFQIFSEKHVNSCWYDHSFALTVSGGDLVNTNSYRNAFEERSLRNLPGKLSRPRQRRASSSNILSYPKAGRSAELKGCLYWKSVTDKHFKGNLWAEPETIHYIWKYLSLLFIKLQTYILASKHK